MHLAPKRIQEYLTHVHQHGGLKTSHAVMRYIFLVLGKYMQMVVAYDIFNKDFDRVTKHFEELNSHHKELLEVFLKVTSHDFEPGREIEIHFQDASQSAESQLSDFLS